MSKKDYQRIARVMHETKDVKHREAWAVIVGALGQVFGEDNPRFDWTRFVEACETGTTRGMKAVQ